MHAITNKLHLFLVCACTCYVNQNNIPWHLEANTEEEKIFRTGNFTILIQKCYIIKIYKTLKELPFHYGNILYYLMVTIYDSSYDLAEKYWSPKYNAGDKIYVAGAKTHANKHPSLLTNSR